MAQTEPSRFSDSYRAVVAGFLPVPTMSPLERLNITRKDLDELLSGIRGADFSRESPPDTHMALLDQIDSSMLRARALLTRGLLHVSQGGTLRHNLLLLAQLENLISHKIAPFTTEDLWRVTKREVDLHPELHF
ncbi:MAG TPA: hypothetical protein VGS08_02890 [Candidatus Saccharimonadales bacterium]|nr:hypothetical protein [Candidatus Saccharimonadales bacterium]